MPSKRDGRTLLKKSRAMLREVEAELDALHQQVSERDQRIAALEAEVAALRDRPGKAPFFDATDQLPTSEADDDEDEFESEDTVEESLEALTSTDGEVDRTESDDPQTKSLQREVAQLRAQASRGNASLQRVAKVLARAGDDPKLSGQLAQTLRYYVVNPLLETYQQLLDGERPLPEDLAHDPKATESGSVLGFVAPPVTMKAGRLSCNDTFKRLFMETLRRDLEQILGDKLGHVSRNVVEAVDARLRAKVNLPKG